MARVGKGEVTPEVLEQLSPHPQKVDASYDEVVTSGRIPDGNAGMGPHMSDVLSAAGTDQEVFITDPGALERNSIGTVMTQPVLTPAAAELKNNAIKGLAEAAITVQNAIVNQHASASYKHELKEIVKQSSYLPDADIPTYIEGRRALLPPEVINTPARFKTRQEREDSLKLLRSIIGHDNTIEVIRCARSAGVTFVQQPLVWLSQMLAVESRKQETYDNIPKDIPFDQEVEGSMEQDIPKTVAKLFSTDTARNIQVLARINQISMVRVVKYMIDRVCKDRMAIVHPATEGGTEFHDIVPTVANVPLAS